MIVCIPLLMAFPIGTYWGASVLLKLNKLDAREVFTASHAQARAATADVKPTALALVFDALGGALMLTSLVAWLRLGLG